MAGVLNCKNHTTLKKFIVWDCAEFLRAASGGRGLGYGYILHNREIFQNITTAGSALC